MKPTTNQTTRLDPTDQTILESKELVQTTVTILVDKLARDIVVLEVANWLAITDHFVIATGNSSRQVRRLADLLEQELALLGRKPLRDEGRTEGEWVLLDYGEMVVHLFSPAAREYYALDKLWGDAIRPELAPETKTES